MNIKKLAVTAMVVLPMLGLAERSHAQRNFYCEDGIQAGSVLVAESGYIPGFVYGQTPGSSVNVRSNPNSESSVIGTVQVGSAIRLRAKTYTVGWSEDLGAYCDIWYQTEQGWIYGEFVRLAEFISE